ncbi:MAG: hydantoinase/oxoprolinase family protein [Gallionellaceae bacterium]|nr:hydantoinase/oxoprolinase family protein [Gallionellaceae bacterium]
MNRAGGVMGWDVGGAHLKAARVEADGVVSGVWQVPCPLWRGMDRLATALDRLLELAGTAAACHGITMTGEMTDLFSSREAGVNALAEAMRQRLQPAPVWFFAGAAGWLGGNDLGRAADRVASANWYATARLLASHIEDALLVDIGSTTTDIIPVRNGGVATDSQGDSDRLAAGELLYTGVVRTPAMALADQAPVAGRWLPVMAEHFATSADVYRVLGWLPEAADQHDSADGGPKTRAASRRRLARMVGRDVGELPEAAWSELAAWFAQAQLNRIERSLRQVLSQALPSADAPLVMAGAGAFLGPHLGARLRRPVLGFHRLLPDSAAEHADWCAPALAVGRLLMKDKPCA